MGRGRRRHDGGDRPTPPQLDRAEARSLFEDAADDLAIGEHVIVFVWPDGRDADARLKISELPMS